MKKLFVILFLAVLLGGCGNANTTAITDPGVVQTAIAQTAAANPTNTFTPEPTVTSTPTLTPSPTPTDTPIPTATFTPTDTPSPTPDLRVINADPQDFLLTADDLPADARYYLPNYTWMSPHRNSEIISGWGVEEGQAYLDATGRVDGWWVSYLRGTSTVLAPEEIYDNVVLYRTSEGAQLVIKQYSTCNNLDSEYTPLDTGTQIGDFSLACIYREMQTNGQNRVWYRIEFVYRNFFHAVLGYGWEREVLPEYVEGVARTLLARLEAAPLSDRVTFEP